MSLLLINPNSSASITLAIRETFEKKSPLPASVSLALTYFTCPFPGPPSIDDHATSALSAAICYPALLDLLPHYDGFLVCCFSDHPLVYILREKTTKPVLGIFHAAIAHSLLIGKKFAIVTSGHSWVNALTASVTTFLGANASDRFAGVIATNLGVLELNSASEHVSTRVKACSAEVVQRGADVVILGCAGMIGRENDIQEGARNAGAQVSIVEGVRAGVLLLAGLIQAK